jgi:hypothetical protein
MTYVALLIDNLHGGLLLEEEVFLQHLGVPPLVVLVVFVCIIAVRWVAVLGRISSRRSSCCSGGLRAISARTSPSDSILRGGLNDGR